MTPSQRSIKHLRDNGYQVANVEHYNAFTKRKHDLFGCIDLLAIGNGETIAVQVTSKSNMSARCLTYDLRSNRIYQTMARSA